MTGTLKEKKIVGATVAVVRDGEVLFAKGYGYADLDTHRPVDPERTLFRIGSVSKLFTWTAVMQLVEAGELDLNADVNDYLDFQIPATYPEPVTLWHLLTHTPGFEDRGFALFSEPSEARGEFLARHMPARVRPPGNYSAYSNHGTALAGYIVERVSGESWYTGDSGTCPASPAASASPAGAPSRWRSSHSASWAVSLLWYRTPRDSSRAIREGSAWS